MFVWIRQKIRTWQNRRLARKLRNLLKTLDLTLKRSGFNRHQRKQFWRDFVKHDDIRWSTVDKFIDSLS
jgi:alanine racemase